MHELAKVAGRRDAKQALRRLVQPVDAVILSKDDHAVGQIAGGLQHLLEVGGSLLLGALTRTQQLFQAVQRVAPEAVGGRRCALITAQPIRQFPQLAQVIDQIQAQPAGEKGPPGARLQAR